jgi:transcriptional regulator with XRE-family HTH domain
MPTVAVGRGAIYSDEHRQLVALLRELRREAGLTQVEVAERLGRPQSYVSKYEQGQRRVDLVDLRAVCNVLGVDLVEVVRRYDARLPRVSSPLVARSRAPTGR